MATKKRSTQVKKSKRTPGKKVTGRKRLAKKKSVKKVAAKKSRSTSLGKTRKPSQREHAAPEQRTIGSRSGVQSGDLQGLRDIESADSESVNELLEEGNAFEADVVAGVEQADDEGREVQTHEVLEDDVPEEYQDKD
jgi:hypothetical protein